ITERHLLSHARLLSGIRPLFNRASGSPLSASGTPRRSAAAPKASDVFLQGSRGMSNQGNHFSSDESAPVGKSGDDGSAGTLLLSWSGAAQSPAQSLVPLTVPMKVHPAASFDFTRTRGLPPMVGALGGS